MNENKTSFLKVITINNWIIQINPLNIYNKGVISGYITHIKLCGYNDEFIRYSKSGKIAYNFPEILPKYLKRKIEIECKKIVKDYPDHFGDGIVEY